MRKRLELRTPTSCINRAEDDEMTFVLLGRDAAAPVAIRAWAMERLRLGKNRIGDAAIAMELDQNFTEDSIVRSGLPPDVFGLIHDLCYHHDGRDVNNYVSRAKSILGTDPSAAGLPSSADLDRYAEEERIKEATARGTDASI